MYHQIILEVTYDITKHHVYLQSNIISLSSSCNRIFFNQIIFRICFLGFMIHKILENRVCDTKQKYLLIFEVL